MNVCIVFVFSLPPMYFSNQIAVDPTATISLVAENFDSVSGSDSEMDTE